MIPGRHEAVGAGRAQALGMEVDFAPPKHSAEYEAKPLPVIPPRASFSIPDLKASLKASRRNLDTKQCVNDWDRQNGNISVTTACGGGTPRSRSLPVNDASSIPTTPSNEILSPQPRHSRQKILRLTGNISPAVSLASLTPSLHNSQQKIKQLTGLDVGSNSPGESQPEALPYALQDDVSPVSPTESTYYREGLEATVSEPDSDASDDTLHSDPDGDRSGVTTQLTAPCLNASSSRPMSTATVSPAARIRLSSFAVPEPDARGERDSVAECKADYRQSNTPGHSDSSRKSSVTAVPSYTTGGSDMAECSPCASGPPISIVQDRGPLPPPFKQRSLIWDTSPIEHLRSGGQDGVSPTSSPPPEPSPSAGPMHRTPGSLSSRRASSKGRVPTPLEPSGGQPLKSGRYSPPQRTPYPPPRPLPGGSAMSGFDTDSDDGKRTSFLGKVFGAGGGAGGGGSTSSKRQSRGPAPSSSAAPSGGQTFTLTSGPDATYHRPRHHQPPPLAPVSPRWPEGLDEPRSPVGEGESPAPAGGGSGRPVSSGGGLFQRARQSIGLRARTRSEKRRETLRGEIRVVET